MTELKEAREIKFRAWDKHSKKMYSWEKLIEYNSENHLSLANCLIGEVSHIILMQYTGLKDIEGKDICESDIIERVIEGDPEEYEFIKKYNGAIGQIEYISRIMGFRINLIKGDGWSFNGPEGPEWVPSELKVIGNIYKNPELLKINIL